MFRARSKARAVRVRVRLLVVVGVGAVGSVAVVQAAANGVPLATVPKPPSSPQQALTALQQKLATSAGPRASAVVGGNAATVTCGQTITKSTTLTADLYCPHSSESPAIYVGADKVVLNLNGHVISGTSDSATGVVTSFAGDTIENGYVFGFTYGVAVGGTGDIVTKMEVAYASQLGIEAVGVKDQVTSNTAVENVYGLGDGGSGDTIRDNHVLNNSGGGLDVYGTGALVSGNIANGNGGQGVALSAAGFPLPTVTGNTANNNAELGILGNPEVIDGGKNTAQGNGTRAQCQDVVCS